MKVTAVNPYHRPDHHLARRITPAVDQEAQKTAETRRRPAHALPVERVIEGEVVDRPAAGRWQDPFSRFRYSGSSAAAGWRAAAAYEAQAAAASPAASVARHVDCYV